VDADRLWIALIAGRQDWPVILDMVAKVVIPPPPAT
jgi:hypothetical protein